MLPPLPDWSSLHPLVIHFPIALLLAAPVLMLAGLIARRRGHCLFISALILIAMGVGGAFLAVATGEAAAELAERSDLTNRMIERHAELAETTRLVFSILGVVYAAMILVPMALRRELNRKLMISLSLAFFLVYSASLLLVVNTAHWGGLLVHQQGVHAMFTPSDPGEIKSEGDD